MKERLIKLYNYLKGVIKYAKDFKCAYVVIFYLLFSIILGYCTISNIRGATTANTRLEQSAESSYREYESASEELKRTTEGIQGILNQVREQKLVEE